MRHGKITFLRRRMPHIVSTLVQVHVVRPGAMGFEHLVLQRSEDEDAFPGMWQVITGGIETGETAVAAATREVLEETGLVADLLCSVPFVASFFDARRDEVHLIPVFLAVVARDSELVLSGEHQAYSWHSYEGAQKVLVLPSHREGLRIVQDYLLGDRGLDIMHRS